ncbi:MAG TPA: substrate-binding domain-containing protein [Trebonia sp.]|nr:substrate-binding domain-containing protein [Trebonia sp.]
MHPLASGFLTTLNAWIDTPQVFSGLVGAAITGLVSLLVSAYVGRRRLGYTVLYDQPVNQGDPAEQAAAAQSAAQRGDAPPDGQRATPSQHMWDIVYRDHASGAPDYEVTNGSLVVMRLRNIGWRTIKDDDFNRDKLTLTFPGRRVVHFKIRDNREYHREVFDAQRTGGADFQAPKPGQSDQFSLPATTLERGESFDVLTLLEDDLDWRGHDRHPRVGGHIAAGKIREYGRPCRWRYGLAIACVAALTAGGVIVGVKIANRGLAVSPVCGRGQLTIEGSTAFAPIFNQVVTEYEQLCSGAQITVRAVGSIAGLSDLKAASDKSSVIAMYDGLPTDDPGLAYDAQPVGDIIFAVVGNRSLQTQKATVFTAGPDGGMTRQQIADAFLFPASGGYHPAGRADISGTRQTFVRTILQGYDNSDKAEDAASGRTCAPGVAGLCLAQTTMDVLQYVSDTQNAIGYAEDDALTFFPNVAAIPIDGYEPTRANALDGNYKFLATEHLYTYGQPRGLAADLIGFLTSAPVVAQLRTTSFIACSDLAGSRLSTDCQPS